MDRTMVTVRTIVVVDVGLVLNTLQGGLELLAPLEVPEEAVPTPVVIGVTTSEVCPGVHFGVAGTDIIETINGTATAKHLATRPSSLAAIHVLLSSRLKLPVILSVRSRVVKHSRWNNKFIVVVVARVTSLDHRNRVGAIS